MQGDSVRTEYAHHHCLGSGRGFPPSTAQFTPSRRSFSVRIHDRCRLCALSPASHVQHEKRAQLAMARFRVLPLCVFLSTGARDLVIVIHTFLIEHLRCFGTRSRFRPLKGFTVHTYTPHGNPESEGLPRVAIATQTRRLQSIRIMNAFDNARTIMDIHTRGAHSMCTAVLST